MTLMPLVALFAGFVNPIGRKSRGAEGGWRVSRQTVAEASRPAHLQSSQAAARLNACSRPTLSEDGRRLSKLARMTLHGVRWEAIAPHRFG